MDEQSGETKEEVIDEGVGELEIEELVPEWGWRRDGVYSRDKAKHNKRSDQLFLQRMMSVAEQE